MPTATLAESPETGSVSTIAVAIDWSAIWTWLFFVVDIGLRILAIIWIPRNRRPQTSAAWLLAILFIPELGWLAFLLFGSRRVGRRRRERQREVNEFVAATTDGRDGLARGEDWPEWLPPIVELNRTLGAMPLSAGNRFEYLPDYEAAIAAMAAAVRGAKRTVHAEFYIMSLDATTLDFFDAMAEAVRRGVVVRVLFDHVANLRIPGYRGTLRFLRERGIIWQRMLPISLWPWAWLRPDLRNHRKLLVVDGDTAFTGSQNLIDAAYHKGRMERRGMRWKDLMVRFEGPIAAEIDALFITDWYSETGDVLIDEAGAPQVLEGPDTVDAQVVPSGPGFAGENNLRLFNSLVYAARRKVIITSPYFVPDDSMLYAITTAAQSGLDVQLFVSEISDQFMVFHAQRSYYEYLLKAGVRIWLYQAPTILHAKALTIDDDVAVVGSSNMDMRSFSLNFEISVMVRSRAFVDRLREIEASYREHSRELTLDEWTARPVLVQALDNVMRLSAALQ